MRLGETNWKKRVGPFVLDLDILTQISFPKDNGKSVEKLVIDIKKNGLRKPLEVNITLEETLCHLIRIYKGNQRIQALKNLGITKAACYVTIEGYKDNEDLGKTIFSLLCSILENI